MTDIEALFRGYLADAPELPGDARERVIERAMTSGRRPRRTRSRRRPRLAVVIPVAAAVAAAVVATPLLIRGSGDITTAVGDARVDWGMRATVRVTPDPGVSREQAMASIEEAYRRRALTQDIPGLTTKRVSDTELEVTVPGATRAEQVPVVAVSASVVDAGDMVVDYTTVGGLRTALKDRRGRAETYLIVPNVPGGDRPSVPFEEVRTLQEAERRIAFLNATVKDFPDRQYRYIPVPAGLRVVVDAGGRGIGANGTESTLPWQISALHSSTSGIRLFLRESGRADSLRAVRALGSRATLIVHREFDGRLAFGAVRVDGDHLLAPSSENVSSSLGFTDIPSTPARVDALATATYGTRPKPRGDTISPLPASIRESVANQYDPRGDGLAKLDVDPDSLVRAVVAKDPGPEVSVFVTRTAAGDDLVYAIGAFVGGPCGALPGPAPMTLCGQESAERGRPMIGRVDDPSIRRVTLEWRGGTQEATLDNGWFIVRVPAKEIPSEEPTEACLTCTGVALVGRDASGDTVARMDIPYTANPPIITRGPSGD